MTLVMAMAFTSCKKDEDDDNNNNGNKTTADYLTTGTWKTTSMKIYPAIDYGGGFIIDDFMMVLPDCTTDDLMTFKANGTLENDEGPTKCNPGDPQTTDDATWSLSSDDKLLTIVEPGEPTFTVTITEINDTMMKGTYTMDEDFGQGTQTYTITITLGR